MAEHPGTILRAAFLEPLGLSASRLAAGLSVDRSTVSRLLSGQQPITPAMAARLGAYFSVPARWWLSMQAEYDAWLVEGRPELVSGVRPLEIDPDVLLTPKGVMPLAAPGRGRSVSEVRTVQYDNGALALVSDDG